LLSREVPEMNNLKDVSEMLLEIQVWFYSRKAFCVILR
jgi:hypothetical protein